MRKIESEKLLERKLGKMIKSIGGWSIKIPATYISGIPDQLCLVPEGRAFFVEVKTTGEKPRKVQLAIHRKLRKLGFQVFVVDCSEDIDWIKLRYKMN